MPQYVTYSVNAKIDKGPEIKSEMKFEAASYGPVLEETLCRCRSEIFDLPIGDMNCVELLVISADKYAAEKDACMPPNGAPKLDDRRIHYRLLSPTTKDEKDEKVGTSEVAFSDMNANTVHPLIQPHSFVGPAICSLATAHPKVQSIAVKNDLPFEVKLSVLVVRKKKINCSDGKCHEK